MTHQASTRSDPPDIGARLVDLIAQSGSASHPYLKSDELTSDRFAARNLADAAHFLCILHGQNPGIIDIAAEKLADPDAQPWIAAATKGLALERVFLANLAAAAGPQPSTPGHSDSDAAVLAQRHALETLARSDRRGCGLGAAIALVVDWRAIRDVLNRAADRFEVTIPPMKLPDAAECTAVAEAVSDGRQAERAMMFGCEQALIQHRNLWTLLDTRQSVREDW